MRISDWSSDVCSSDLVPHLAGHPAVHGKQPERQPARGHGDGDQMAQRVVRVCRRGEAGQRRGPHPRWHALGPYEGVEMSVLAVEALVGRVGVRSEEHTSELQSLMRISYAVFCLKKKNKRTE